MEWAITLSGFGVGILIGLTGVGGGSLMTPILIFLFQISPIIAVGTDLLFASITKIGGIWAHSRHGTINWKIVGLLAAGSLPTAMITVYFLEHFHEEGIQVDTLIKGGLGLALILTSLSLLFKTSMHKFGNKVKGIIPHWQELRSPVTIFAGILLGILVPVSSIGAGALGAAMLLFLYPKIPTRNIVGTDLAHAVPLTAVAGIGHMHMGTIDYSLLGSLILGSLPGIYFGSHLSTVVPEKILRPILASMLMLIGVKFMFS
ncbi:MAG TPA: sulfite exporter TauE/SafE family protein [Gammaproteobacteria bacterium]